MQNMDLQTGYSEKLKILLSDESLLLQLPYDHKSSEFEYLAKTRVLPHPLLGKLNVLSEQADVDLNILFFSAFQTLLYRYTHQKAFLVGSPNKKQHEEEMLLVLKADLSDELTFLELLKRTKESYNAAEEVHPMSIYDLKQELRELEEASVNQLLQAIYLFDGALDGCTQDVVRAEQYLKEANCDLLLSVLVKNGNLSVMLTYNSRLFAESTIERILEHFNNILYAVASEPNKELWAVSMLSQDEYHKLVVDWNNTKTDYPRLCIHQLFEQQVEKYGDKTALIYENQTLTYDALNEKANRLAHYLRKHGVGPDTFVGICMERSTDLIVGILGILKAGGAYVPFDPTYPEERLIFMMKDVGVSLIITQKQWTDKLKASSTGITYLDIEQEDINKECTQNPTNEITIQNLAYVMYTSGSTGQPKGVCIPHRAVVRLVKDTNFATLSADETLLHFAPISFDASTLEIFGSLLNGGRLVIFPSFMPSLDELGNVIRKQGVTTLWLTAGLFHQMVENNLEDFENVRQLLAGGDVLSTAHVKKVIERFRGLKLINGYGPTENTTFTCCYTVKDTDTVLNTVPIGRPIANTTVYILDSHMQPVPIGVWGELYTGGDGLAGGYLNNPALTKDRFIINPFGSQPQDRLYKTGDLVRYLPDGNIEFLGRTDQQVKIRGFRIEPEEIEALLKKHEGVREAVVIPHQFATSDKRLVAYIVPDPKFNDSGNVKEAEDLQKETVTEWELLFDNMYNQSSDDSDPSFNIAGWNSSYTGEAIPPDEMKEWVSTTVERILSLKPKRVLELCCGTGLLLHRIAPYCERYWGTDFSGEVINMLHEQLKKNAHLLQRIELFRRTADDFEGVPADCFDCIIINSAVQYFPSVDYLKQVLENSIKTIRSNGHIFIGDIRNLKLLNAYHTSVELYKASEALPGGKLFYNVQKGIMQENELLIDPEFFLALAQQIPEISHVEVLPKRGKSINELTQYRYDVILHIKSIHQLAKDILWLDWKKDKMTLPDIRHLLEEEKNDAIGIKRVANMRVLEGIKVYECLTGKDMPENIEKLRDIIKHEINEANGVNPEEFFVLTESLPYQVEISWANTDSSGSYDVVFYKGHKKQNIFFKSKAKYQALDTYGNNPLQAKFFNKLVPKLQSYLKKLLPDYMIPSYYMPINSIPLTMNGKVNRKALPLPIRVDSHIDYIPPNTQNEELVAGFFAQILGMERVSMHNDFFECGGNSLLATQMISRIRDTFRLELPLRTIFESPTVYELSKCIEALEKRERSFADMPIIPVEQDDNLPLSFAQQRLWFLQELYPNSIAYNIPMAFHIKGTLDTDALIQSLKQIVHRHDSLRTLFKNVDGNPVQCISSPTDFTVSIIDMQRGTVEESWNKTIEMIEADAKQPFDLSKGPLFKASLFELGNQEYVVYLNMHHIVSDGWSMNILFDEMSKLYSNGSGTAKAVLEELPVRYADFANWQRQWMQGDVLDKQLAYWKQKLTGDLPKLQLPTDRPRPAAISFRGAVHKFVFPKRLTEELKRLSLREGVTLYMTLLAAFKTLLYRYTNQEDIIVGSPIANRNHGEIEGLIGFFVNTLVLRTDLSGNPGFRELLKRVQKVAMEAYDNQDIPFEKLVSELQPNRDINSSPLLNVMFQIVPPFGLALPGLNVEPIEIDNKTAKFDLYIPISEEDGKLVSRVEYNSDLYDADTIERMMHHFQTLLEGIISNPNLPLCKLPIMTQKETRQMLVEWNNTNTDFPKVCIHQVFEEQVQKYGHKTALIYQDQKMTYTELNNKANQLAHYLRKFGVGPDTLVGICMARSMTLIVGILGILKAGGAYVPLDPSYPQERLKFMIEDTEIPLVITTKQFADKLPLNGLKVVCPDAEQADINQESHKNLVSKTTNNNIAYVMYTSGSTGKSKGVCIPHRGVVRLVKGTNYAEFSANETMMHFAPVSFDASTLEIFGCLLNGGKLVVFPSFMPSFDQLGEVIKKHKITTLFLTAGLFHQMIESNLEDFANVRQLLSGGDVISVPHVKKVVKRFESLKFINAYGPTENTTITTCYTVRDIDSVKNTLPIGRPIANTTVYILDQHLQPVPVGVPGELYTGGGGLAGGYLNNKELTQERFIENPFGNTPDDKLYKTGDLVRYLPDGNIEFLGRIDDQVKIRGFRVEPGEVEGALAKQAEVEAAAVAVKVDNLGSKQLVAYVVLKENNAFLLERIQDYIEKTLPSYMRPAAYVLMDSLPLTPNGKIDKKALPMPDDIKKKQGEKHTASKNPIEEVMIEIWSKVLNIKDIGIDDNFFELGGHSLLATQLVSQIRSTFRVNLIVQHIFELPTIKGLAEKVTKLGLEEKGIQTMPIKAASRAGHIPLSFAQKRLWFFNQLEPQSPLYNVPLISRIKGKIDIKALGKSFNTIINRHEILRTTFKEVNGVPMQIIAEKGAINLIHVDLSGLEANEREAAALKACREEVQRPFDLTQGPLLRVTLISIDEQTDIMIINMHHIICDGWSLGLLNDELAKLYAAYKAGIDKTLPELPLQYTDFAIWQQQWQQGEEFNNLLRFWETELSGNLPELKLPTDKPRPAVQAYRGNCQRFYLPTSLTEAIMHISRSEGATPFMTLLSAFKILLYRYTGQTDIIVGSPIANRNRSEIEGMIGFFVNTLVLRTELSENLTFRELLGRVRETTLKAYVHQDIPFDKLVERLHIERSAGVSPLFQVMFALQNTPMQSLELPELTLEKTEIHSGTAKFDLCLIMDQDEKGLSAWFEYNTDLFEDKTIHNMFIHFQSILESIIANPNQKLSVLALRSNAFAIQPDDDILDEIF